ncbi:MAG: hypothetical protein SFV24_04265 [Gemmatimonadales bacterium]|nr:hypothetical protein [Gemmatimonadales bacterium]MDX2056993.1 hypothetical protein [Gemmatimonadales bacterium]
MIRFRFLGAALAAGLLTMAEPVQAQAPAASGVYGGFAPRFVPLDVWTRMLSRPETAPGAFSVAAPADSVWAALGEVLKRFDVPLAYADRAAGEMGVVRTKLYRRMGKEPLSNFLRCGEGLTGPNADTYMVYLSAVGMIKAGSDGTTTVLTLISGDAVDVPNGRNEVVPCTTSGQFEEKVAKAVRKRLGVDQNRE